jgi:hypothetical protein
MWIYIPHIKKIHALTTYRAYICSERTPEQAYVRAAIAALGCTKYISNTPAALAAFSIYMWCVGSSM